MGKRVLNIGGGAGGISVPDFAKYKCVVLDIDEAVKPDIVLDALALTSLPAEDYEAVFSSHMLEHFYQHQVQTVLNGCWHVLKDDGRLYVIVPSFTRIIEGMQSRTLQPDDVWYRTASGIPITFHDALYGWSHAMKQGNLYYAHKCTFTSQMLMSAFVHAGFSKVEAMETEYDLHVRGVKCLSQ